MFEVVQSLEDGYHHLLEGGVVPRGLRVVIVYASHKLRRDVIRQVVGMDLMAYP